MCNGIAFEDDVDDGDESIIFLPGLFLRKYDLGRCVLRVACSAVYVHRVHVHDMT